MLHVPSFKGTGWKLEASFTEGWGLKSRTGTSFSSLIYVLLHTAPEGMIWGFCWCDWSAAAELGGLIQCWVYRAANEICWGKTFSTAAPRGFAFFGITTTEYSSRADPSASDKKQWNMHWLQQEQAWTEIKILTKKDGKQTRWKKKTSVVVFAINIYLQLLVNTIEEERKDLIFLRKSVLYLVQKWFFFFMSKYLPIMS